MIIKKIVVQQNLKKSVKADVFAPMKGKVIKLEDVNDGVFSEGMLGNGAAIEPVDGKVFAPFDGEVQMVYDTKHAIGLISDSGVELLIHVGIDTVQLNGKYYDVKVQNGQKISKGDILVNVNLAGIAQAGYRTVTPVIVTNSDDFSEINVTTNDNGDINTKIISIR